ncbi:hypothetical protein JCM3775_006264 [Rhodotorula graminis]|uniref:Transferase family protein n=1 Tax=Rhodotorula graminis (strain WP1) TaxID=578459 RepID=A0A194S299_RHOGW|nr:uncharacterized protein RHOBADRAFT_44159 [Rhodotorula graminis WP1]KPV74645.1 hypothetical protein RHOBADRAFT_44159 [Rhodotorula graminis WP1]
MTTTSPATSLKRIFPRAPSRSTSKPLSIIDSVCSAFFSFAAVKLYPAVVDQPDPFKPALVEASLGHVLSAYPHWAGRLRLAKPDDPGRPYQKRFGRIFVEYGSPSDPGVLLAFAERDTPLAPLIPPLVEGETVDAASLERAGVYPELSSVVTLRPSPTDGAALAVQVLRFSCGGVAVGFRVSHSLADAGTLNRFVADWADVHRVALASPGSLDGVPLPHRPFEPELLDEHAMGDLDADELDEATEREYAKLPRTALDLWAPRPGSAPHPEGMALTSGPDPSIDAVDAALGRPRGSPLPWSTWHLDEPVSLRSLYLAPPTLERIWAAAGGREGGVSAHDALVGHFWRLSVRARDLTAGTEARITPAVGLRARLDPPLSPDALGSNFVLLASSSTSDKVAGAGGEAVAARAIRSTIDSASPAALGALLSHEAHALDPVRVQPYFCGEEHTSMSSWIGAGAYGADFGSGAPTYAEGVLPSVDGMLLFEDVPGEGRKWIERGARVKLALRNEVMDKVLSDPELLSL